jgi:hypothetical protein
MEQATMGGAATDQPTAQPTATQTVEEVTADAPTREEIDAAVPTREESAVGAPPLSSEVEEEVRPSSLAQVGEPSAEVRAPDNALDLGKGPMTSSAMVGWSAQGEEAQADSKDEEEEIQGHPHDGHQHIYV